MANSILRLQHLTKQFGRFKALDDLSLDVVEGEVFTMLGPSGCGKTTTLRCIAGLESPDSGRIMLRDRTLVSTEDGIFVPTYKRNMGMVFQSYAIWHFECAVTLRTGQSVLLSAPRSGGLVEGQKLRLGIPSDSISLWPL